MKDLLLFLVGIHGVRYSRRQKFKFLKMVIETFSKLGYQSHVIKNKGTHVLLGQPALAKTIVAVGFDTPTRNLLKTTEFYPFDETRNRKTELKNLLITSLALLLIVFLAFYFYAHYFDTMLKRILFVVILTLVMSFFRPRALKYDVERYTASLTVLFDLATKTMIHKEVAYLLVDQSNVGGLGFQVLDKFDQKKIIVLGALAKQPQLYCAGYDNDLIHDFMNRTDLNWSKKILDPEKVPFNQQLKLLYLVATADQESVMVQGKNNQEPVNLERLQQISDDILNYLGLEKQTRG